MDRFPHEELHKRFICENHFKEQDFVNPDLKCRLKNTAVPRMYNEHLIKNSRTESNLRKSVLKTYQRIREKSIFSSEQVSESPATSASPCTAEWVDKLIELPLPDPGPSTSSSVDNEEIRKKDDNIFKLRKRLEEKDKKLGTLRTKICRLKQRSRQIKYSYSTKITAFNFVMEYSKALVTMQMKKKQRQWYLEEKKFALILYYKSPSAYKYLRRMIVLPSISSIKQWIGKSKFMPGLNQFFFNQLKLKTSTLTEMEKKVVISFDEMAIKEHLEYSKYLDLIEGYEDLGHLGRTTKTAKTALVFMARSIYSSWKLPICYFLSNSGVSSRILVEILKEVLQKCFQCELIIKGVVCDQAPQNQSTFRSLGISKEKPYFDFELDNQSYRIVAIFDPMHLIKSVRNNLLNGNYIRDGKIITFSDIRLVYELDKNKTIRALPKLTESHIFPTTFQRMNVKLAMQVFSHSVASAIETCIHTGEITTYSAKTTAIFVGKFICGNF